MAHSDEPHSLCEKITAAMKRRGLGNVQCQENAKGLRLTGTVDSNEERSIAFAIALTTAGTTNLTNGIEVRKPAAS